jgi:predicted amidohydrolase
MSERCLNITMFFLSASKNSPLGNPFLVCRPMAVQSSSDTTAYPMKINLAMIQMRVDGGSMAANLQRALDRINHAVDGGAQLLLLPEAMDLGWTDDSARSSAEPVPGGTPFDTLADAARRHRVYICAGLTERAGPNVYNSAVLLSPHGDLLLRHRKLNELEIGHSCYDQGDRLGVAHTSLGTIGLMICADAFAPGQPISRTLGLMGADLILSPCAWAVPADHDQRQEPYGQIWLEHYVPVARAFRLWIAGVSNVGPIHTGPWKGRKCIGCSLLIGPDGDVVTQGPYGENADTVLKVRLTIEPRPARGDGWAAWERIASERSPA